MSQVPKKTNRYKKMADIATSIVSFFVVITLIVVVHEGGHFSAAKICRVRVLAFSIGFGRKLFSLKKGGTVFSFSAIPLGGYVQMLELKDRTEKDSIEDCFEGKSLFARSFIIAAGPMANFILACVVYWIIFIKGIAGPIPYVGEIPVNSVASESGLSMDDRIIKLNKKRVETWEAVHREMIMEILKGRNLEFEVANSNGERANHIISVDKFNLNELDKKGPFDQIGLVPKQIKIPAVISKVINESPAYKGGLVAGDTIVSVQNTEIDGWAELVEIIQKNPETPLLFGIYRNGETFDKLITPELVQKGERRLGRVGIQGDISSFYSIQRYGALDAVWLSLERTFDMTLMTLRSLMKLVTMELSFRNLSGPITIADYAGKSMESGLDSFLAFLALISISIGIINLLPIPMLDGGHLLYNILEFISGRKLPTSFYIATQKIGLAILLSLFLIAIFNDIFRIIN